MMTSPHSDADTIDLADVARNVVRGWPVVLGGVALGAAVAGAVLFFVPARFTATTSIVVRASESSTSSLTARLGGSIAGAAAGLLPGGLTSAPIETELQILSSRALAGEAVDSLLLQLRVRSAQRNPPWQLFQAAAFPGAFKRLRLSFERTADSAYTVSGVGTPVTLRPGIPARVGDGSLTLGQLALPSRFTVDVYDRQEAITRFRKRIAVSKAGGEVVAITFGGDDSLSAAQVPNLMVRRYLVRRHTTDRGLNERRVAFLSAQVDSVEQSLTAAEVALRQQQEKSGIVDPVVVGKIELERAGALRQASGALDVERGALNQMLVQLGKGQLTSTQVAAFPTFLKSPGINELLGQLSTLQTRRLQLLATLTPDEPSVIAASEGIKNIEAQIPALARAYATSLDQQRADVAKQLDTLRSAIERLPASSEASVRLLRKVIQNGQVSAALRAQLVEARLATVGEGGDVRMLDIAEPPRKVTFPQPALTVIAGLGGGLLLGLLAAMLSGLSGKHASDERTITGHADG